MEENTEELLVKEGRRRLVQTGPSDEKGGAKTVGQ